MPPIGDEIVHKALASDIRKKIILSIAKKDKYLSEIALEIKLKPQTIDFHLKLLEEIGLVNGEWKEGRKYYSLKEKKIIDFIEHGRAIPPEFRPRPPHEIVLDMWEDIKKRLDKLERKLDELSKKSTQI